MDLSYLLISNNNETSLNYKQYIINAFKIFSNLILVFFCTLRFNLLTQYQILLKKIFQNASVL